MVFKIVYHKDKCIACGACVAICPDNWEFFEDKVHPKKTEFDNLGCNKEAQENCPVEAIEIQKQ